MKSESSVAFLELCREFEFEPGSQAREMSLSDLKFKEEGLDTHARREVNHYPAQLSTRATFYRSYRFDFPLWTTDSGAIGATPNRNHQSSRLL